MKAVLQRVSSAKVEIDGKIIGKIGKGLMILLGVVQGDGVDEADFLAEKAAGLRIFEDENGKMNRSVSDINGEILVVSQFTLAANCKKGTRPSFDSAMEPLSAKKAYEDFVLQLRKAADNGEVKSIQTGVFAADMKISLINDGPVTILL